MPHESDPTVGQDVHDLIELTAKVIGCWDEFPAISGVVSPMDNLMLQHGVSPVTEAINFARRMGFLEAECNQMT